MLCVSRDVTYLRRHVDQSPAVTEFVPGTTGMMMEIVPELFSYYCTIVGPDTATIYYGHARAGSLLTCYTATVLQVQVQWR